MSDPLDAVAEATRAQGQAAHPHVSVFVTANAGPARRRCLWIASRASARRFEAVRVPLHYLHKGGRSRDAAPPVRTPRRLVCCRRRESSAELEKLGAQGGADLSPAPVPSRKRLKRQGGPQDPNHPRLCERLLARFPLEAHARFSTLLMKRAPRPCSATLARKPRFRTVVNATPSAVSPSGFTAITLKACSIALRAPRRVSPLRAKHQGELFAAQELRERHGVTQNAEDYTTRNFSRAGVGANCATQRTRFVRQRQ
ncbi:MAG: hypothetical protein IPL62_17860 [Caulobacteraceae bacterium]|nr:hypothetical protein [Caulobacteraceae bacterium]